MTLMDKGQSRSLEYYH